MSVTATHAVKPPAFAPAPPAQREAEGSPGFAEAPRRLLTSLSAMPAVQRACAGCGGEKDDRDMPVMPQLEVGPVDDPYEREADEIAGRVMALRAPGAVRRTVDDEEPEIMARRSVVRRADAEDEPGVIPRRAAVQRKCASCSGEDTPVTPQLEVGPVDDPYEREADDIAGRVMALRSPAALLNAGGAGADMEDVETVARRPRVQRKCGGCSGGDDDMPVMPLRAAPSVQRVPAALLERETLRDLTEMPRMRADGAAGTEHIAASASELGTGGSPMSPDTREFFEARMGRDLSDVRVHRGGASEALNHSIASRAFTFQNHIWLGRTENEGPSFTMAHELVHVLQQTQPGPVRAARRGTTASRALIRRAPELKFSGNAYWTSSELEAARTNSGSQIHKDLLEQFQKKHPELFVEVSIPKGLRSATGQARSGKADLYTGKDRNNAERTIGINFRKKGDPTHMASGTDQRYHSPAYNHKTSARPWLRGKSTIMGAKEAPTRISLGELKPDKVKKGKRQLEKYRNGISRTWGFTNDFLKEQHEDSDAPPQWPDISFSDISVEPPNISGANGKSFGRHKLHVYQFVGVKKDTNWAIGNLVHEPPVDVYGELKVKKHKDGIYYYWWEPDVKAPASALPPELARNANLTDDLFTALRTNRKVVLPRRKAPRRSRVAAQRAPARPAAYAPGGRPAAQRPRVMRRKSGNAKKFPNHFDKSYETEKWLPNRKKVKDAYNKVARSYTGAKGPETLTDWYLIEIDKDLDSGDRQNVEQKFKARGKAYERTRQLRKMHILAQRFAPMMAKLRRLFGGVFARGSELYERIKAKFADKSRPKGSVSGGGILGALIRASFKVLLLIGRQIVASTMIQLTEQLKTCMTNMFKSYFSIDEQVEAIEARINGVKGNLEQEIEAFIGGDIETQVETLFGRYGKKVEEVRDFIETMQTTAGPIMTAYKVVRWGIQALACASPPLVGCLWGLAARAIEWAAGKVMETCWFMKKVTPKILRIQKIKDFMSDTSLLLANGIIEAGSSLFPDPVGAFLKNNCKAEKPTVGMPSPSSICEEGGGSGGMGNDPKPSQEALDFWDRWRKLPFAKQMALKKMLGQEIAKGSAKVDWDKMNKMLDWAESRSVSDMERAADAAAKGDSSAIPSPVAEVKAAAEASQAKSGGKSKETGGAATGADGGTADGNEGDESEFAKRTGKISGKGGTPASDLSARVLVTAYEGTPQKAGEKVSGLVVVSWRKPSGERVARYIRNVTLAFQRVAPETIELNGEQHPIWIFRSTSKDTYKIEGRDQEFYFPPGRDIPLIVSKVGEGKK